MSTSLIDRVPADYVRPTCPECGQRLQFVHFRPGGSRYACLPCEFGMEDDGFDYPMGNHEASWIIRNTQEHR